MSSRSITDPLESLLTARERLASIVVAGFFLAVFVWMYQITQAWPPRPAEWPRLLLMIGMLVSVALIIQQVIAPGSDDDDVVSKYLSGGESSYSPAERAKRLLVTAVWIIAFFPLSRMNTYLAITVCFAGMMLSLGMRDPKRVVAAIVIMNAFVFLVFQQALNMPIAGG